MLGLVPYKLDFPAQGEEGGTSASGTWTFQNSTPTDVRFANSEPGFGDTAPYSARTYANQAGSIGKANEVQAPADLARPYMCDLDNSRPGTLAPRLAWERSSNGTRDSSVFFANTTGGGTINTQIYALVNSPTFGMGAICGSAGGTDADLHLWRYDVTGCTYIYDKRVYSRPGAIGTYPAGIARPYQRGPTYDLGGMLRGPIQYGIINETNKNYQTGTGAGATGKHLWVPLDGGGAVDITQAYVAGTGQPVVHAETQFWHFVSFGGYLVTFEQTSIANAWAGMTVSLRDPDTLDVLLPTTLSGIDAAPELGNQPIQEPIPDVLCCHPPLVYSGGIYICTDRSVIKIVYDDENARILAVPIHTTFSRITGNPEIFQGSLFVPSGNVLWKWTPGQLEFTPIPIDSFGDLPGNRGGGNATALKAVANGLIVAMQSDPVSNTDSVLLLMDQNNVFQMLDYSPNNGAIKAGVNQGIMYFVDTAQALGGAAVGVVCTDTTNRKRVISVRESVHDPAYMPISPSPAGRKQVGGSHFWLSPVDPGVGYGDFKQSLKIAAACADVSAAQLIRIYYQTDYEGLLADQCVATGGATAYAGPFVGTLLEGMGRWHLAMTLSNNPRGSDGNTYTTNPLTLTPVTGGYAGFVQSSTVALNISYRQIRWMVEIIGDQTGALYPRLTGFKAYYSETPAMYIVHALRIRILANDPDLSGSPRASFGSYPPPQSADDVYSHFNQIYTYAKTGAFIDFLDPNGVSRKGKITKLIFNGVSLVDTPDGIPTVGRRRFDRVILQLALQEADSAA